MVADDADNLVEVFVQNKESANISILFSDDYEKGATRNGMSSIQRKLY